MFKPLNSRTISAIAAIAAMSSPAAASAMYAEDGPVVQQVPVAAPSPQQQQQLDQLQRNVSRQFASQGGWHLGSSARAAASSSQGFQWDDAGIGAAGAVVLLGAGAVASGAVRRRRSYSSAIG
jgi:hypothetical protein